MSLKYIKAKRYVKKALVALSVYTLMLVQPITAFAEAYEFRTGNDGKFILV